MISRTVDITEIRRENSVYETLVTPILEKFTGAAMDRDDISATLKPVSILGFQEKTERTRLQAEYESLGSDNDILLKEEDIETFSPTDDINEDRITLLARKYATKHMLPEDAARLNILTQRLRNAMPGITEKDLEIMEGLNKQLESANRLNDRLQEKYK